MKPESHPGSTSGREIIKILWDRSGTGKEATGRVAQHWSPRVTGHRTRRIRVTQSLGAVSTQDWKGCGRKRIIGQRAPAETQERTHRTLVLMTVKSDQIWYEL